MDPGEYDACTYCGKTIFPGVAECPYCHHYTDGKGPLGTDAEEPRKLSPLYVTVGWVLVILTVLPLLWALWRAFTR